MTRQYSAVICSFIRPFLPGRSGGEIRDYHLFRHIGSFASVKLISVTNARPAGREDGLGAFLREYYEPDFLRSDFPEFINHQALRRSLFTRFIGLLRQLDIPVGGQKYHRDISLFSWQVDAYVLPMLRRLLQLDPPDFLLVTPQLNPTLLRLGQPVPPQTRTILLTYDVEAVRLSRLAEAGRGIARVAKRLESRRAERFERENIRKFDGLVVVSELDKATMIEKYDFDAERILVVENSVDTDYFSFTPRAEDSGDPNIVFVGNLAYWPNHDAAVILLSEIMPRIRSVFPQARAWIVGERPSPELKRIADPALDVVTGPVNDVRSFLRQASLVCIPLRAGSGTKFKMLEALSAGRPVVCSPLAAEGLDIEAGTHFIVAEGSEQIASACVRVLSNPESCEEMLVSGRKLIEARYSWERSLEKAQGWFEKIRQMPRRGE